VAEPALTLSMSLMTVVMRTLKRILKRKRVIFDRKKEESL
jgi:hypothetical protein